MAKAQDMIRWLNVAHAQRKRAHRKAVEEYGEGNEVATAIAQDMRSIDETIVELMKQIDKQKK